MKDSAINQLVSSGPVNFNVVAKGDIENLKKKDGGTYQKQNVVLEIPATGEKITVQMFPKFVAYLKEGGMVRCEAGEKYPEWKFVNSDDVPAETNFKQVKNERAATVKIPEIDRERIAHDWKLGIAGLLQAHIIAGASREEARKMAVEDAEWVRTKALEIASLPASV